MRVDRVLSFCLVGTVPRSQPARSEKDERDADAAGDPQSHRCDRPIQRAPSKALLDDRAHPDGLDDSGGLTTHQQSDEKGHVAVSNATAKHAAVVIEVKDTTLTNRAVVRSVIAHWKDPGHATPALRSPPHAAPNTVAFAWLQCAVFLIGEVMKRRALAQPFGNKWWDGRAAVCCTMHLPRIGKEHCSVGSYSCQGQGVDDNS